MMGIALMINNRGEIFSCRCVGCYFSWFLRSPRVVVMNFANYKWVI